MRHPLFLCALVTSAIAGPPVLVRVTAADIARLQQSNPMKELQKPAEGEAKVSTPAEQSIIKQSVILHDGKNWTIVPKGAVIFLPEAMKSRVDAKPVGKLMAFNDFLAANCNWLTTHEVTFGQAAGDESLPAERVGYWSKQEKIVVAVHQDGPISVRVAGESQVITQR